jgi:hypothetical protein
VKRIIGTEEEEKLYREKRRSSTARCVCGSYRFFAEACPKCGALGGDTEECAEIFIRAIEKWTPEQKRQARESLDAKFQKQKDERLLSAPCDPTVN